MCSLQTLCKKHKYDCLTNTNTILAKTFLLLKIKCNYYSFKKQTRDLKSFSMCLNVDSKICSNNSDSNVFQLRLKVYFVPDFSFFKHIEKLNILKKYFQEHVCFLNDALIFVEKPLLSYRV